MLPGESVRPCSKRSYDRRSDAKRVAKRVGLTQAPYKCPACGLRHLTTMRPTAANHRRPYRYDLGRLKRG